MTRAPERERVRAGVLISGRGTTMASLLAAASDPDYPAEIAVVVCNRADALGVARARAMGVQVKTIDHRPFGRDRQAHEAAVDGVLREHEVAVVCLAGYMRLFTPWFIERWRGRMLNIHPALLPLLPGLNTHARALAEGHVTHGCTVHLVTEGMDEGPIIDQQAVPVLPTDTADTLAARVLAQEHILYPRALCRFLKDWRLPDQTLPQPLRPP